MSFADIARGPAVARTSDIRPDDRLAHVSARFHTSFNWPKSPQDVILQSSDGVSFYFNIQLLAVYSGFFAEMEEMTSLELSTEAFHPKILLPSATSVGLEIVLLAITTGEQFPFPSIPRAKLAYGIQDAMGLSDPYDIPLFSLLTPLNILTGFTEHPFLLYALSAVMGSEDYAKRASRMTLPLSIGSIPHEAEELLLERAPMYHTRLIHLHRHIRPKLLSFRQSLALNEEVKGTMKFGQECLEERCHGVKMSNGDFHRLRKQVATSLWSTFTEQGSEWNFNQVREAVMKMVGCEECGTRIAGAVLGAIRKHPLALGLRDTI